MEILKNNISKNVNRLNDKIFSPNKSGSHIIGLLLIGAGLLLIGIVSGVILLKPNKDMRGAVDANGSISLEGSVVPVGVYFNVPSFNLKDLQGYDVSLEDYRGKVILINNWATWCPPCKAEMPTLEAYYQAHKDEGFVLVAINAGDPPASVDEFIRSYKLTFPIWLDTGSQALQAFKNYGLPSSYVIDKDFNVRLAWTGAIGYTTLEQYVTPLVQE